jgi:anthranilate phosphoribosyltransferase
MSTVQRAPTRGRAGYDGFKAMIKAIGTGPRGSRDLTFDEARMATAALIAGEVSPAQAGAFLLAMRVKGEAAEELAGVTQALRDAALPLRPPSAGRPLVACAGAFDGVVDAPQLSLAAAAVAAAAGVDVVVACGGPLGPKNGVTQADVLAALGGTARPGPDESSAMLERAGVALVNVCEALPGWERLAAVRDEIGVRGPIHTAEKLVDWGGARRFVVGYTHGAYAARITGALRHLGAERAFAVRGIEGSDVLRPGRPHAADADGPLELPERLGEVVRGGADAAAGASLTRAVVTGDHDGPAAGAVVLSAAVRLIAGGAADGPETAVALARAAIDEGRAAAALDALVG